MRVSLLVLLSVVAVGCEQAHSTVNVLHNNQGSSPTVASSSASTETTAAAKSEANKEFKTVSFRVDGMSCPHGCYPSVREAIAKQKTVDNIELAPQKEEDVIDNPIVTVKYHGDFDVAAAKAAIADAGFDKVDVVTN